jgi:uncharacterized protein (UPF0332 family)
VTPEVERFLEKSRKLLGNAHAALEAGLNEDAGRSAYLAAFHASQALIFERLGKVFKTHKGVHTEFQRLTKDDKQLDPDLRTFLSRSYDLKSIADYETGPGSTVSAGRAAEAVETAEKFVAHFAGAIDPAKRGSP